MKFIRYSAYLLISLAIAGCTGVSVNNSVVETLPETGHQHDEEPPYIPKLEQNSNAVVKIENLTPSVKLQENSFEIKTFNGFKPELKKHKNIFIEKVVLTETGQSVMEENSPAQAAIEPDYAGKIISLTITGKFNTTPKIKLEHMLFTNEPGLIHQSVVEAEPLIRVLLDDLILFSPVSASDKEIKVKIDTRGIPEFYLKGLHKLTIIANQYFSDTLVKVGDPVPVNKLSPSITSVEVLRDDKGKPVNLKLTGRNFMLYYRFSYSQIDGVFGFGHQTNVIEENGLLSWETIVHIPNPGTFDNTNQHTISYATPFGMAFKSF